MSNPDTQGEDQRLALADDPVTLLRGWAKAYRESPEHRFPSDPNAEFFPVDLEAAANEIAALRRSAPDVREIKRPVQGWEVEVRINGATALTIGHNHLSGMDNIGDFADIVENCARHLMSFIGGSEVIPPMDVRAAVIDPFAIIPNHLFWMAAKGRLKPSEPLYAVQIIDPESGVHLTATEAETLEEAIAASVRSLATPATKTPHSNTVADSSGSNPGAIGASKEADATTGFATVASASTKTPAGDVPLSQGQRE